MLHIFRKTLILSQTKMEVIPHVISLSHSIVTIVDTKEGNLSLPDTCFSQICNNTDPILVVGEHRSRMTICRVSSD